MPPCSTTLALHLPSAIIKEYARRSKPETPMRCCRRLRNRFPLMFRSRWWWKMGLRASMLTAGMTRELSGEKSQSQSQSHRL